MERENNEVVYQLRQRERAGVLPGVLIKHESKQGFFVESAVDMPELALLCEYVGEVRTNRKCVFNTNDSIMELLDTGDTDTSLSIVPE